MVQREGKCNIMNNVEKNSYVKKQITSALLLLLKEKELRDISVSEICSIAEVSRISFYRNYEDKEQIVKEYISLTLTDWNKDKTQSNKNTADDALGDIFAYILANEDFYLLLSNRGLLQYLKLVIMDLLGPKREYENIVAYTTAFIANGIYGWIEEWFSRGMQESGDEMTEMLKNRKL